MIHCEEIDVYLEYYEKNKKHFNLDRIDLIENIVKPLLKRTDIVFDEDTFKNCILYCEKNYYSLFPYQKFIYAFVFMYDLEDTPIYSTFLVLMGRGNGKDGAFMPLMNFLQTPLYNVKKYNIDIVANNEAQAKDSYDVVYDKLNENKKKFKSKFYISKEIIKNYTTGSVLRYNTSNAKTKDGKVGGAILFNEFHAYESNEQINVFLSQRGKIKHPRTFIITTNGYVRNGPLDERLEAAREILKTGINDLKVFPFLCCLDSVDEVDNPNLWIKANPSLPYMNILKKEIEQAYVEMKKYPSQRPEFLTKRCNLPQVKEQSAIASWKDILKCSYSNLETKEVREIPNLENASCIIGIDYADIRDFASAGLLFKVDDEYIFIQKTWICKNSPFFENIKFGEHFKNTGMPGFTDYEILDTKSIPIDAIISWCLEQMNKYNVLKIVLDTYRYSLFKVKFEEVGISIEEKNNGGIVRLIRRSNSIYVLLVPLIEQLFTDNKLNIGNSAIMRWYINNTGTKVDTYGNKNIVKIEPKLRKNDGFSAFVHAFQAKDLLEELVIYV